MKNIFLVFLVSLMPNLSFSSIVYTNGIGGGDWGNPLTWNPVGVPGCVDTISIVAGDFVTITSTQDYEACGPMVIIVSGTIDFPNNGPRLELPCDSYIDIPAGGTISAPGNDNSNKISICNTFVWTSNQPDLTGPTSLGNEPLPIELLSFQANTNDNKVDLKWITAQEINNDYFTVEKSQDSQDWEVISIVNGAGNSSQVLTYFESDYNPFSGISYYRLKQTDFDGTHSYSNLVPVRFEVYKEGTMNLFPNPVLSGNELKLSFDEIEEEEILVVLRDLTGKEFFSKLFISIENGALIGLPIEKAIPKGVYLITATSENKIYSQKLIVK